MPDSLTYALPSFLRKQGIRHLAFAPDLCFRSSDAACIKLVNSQSGETPGDLTRQKERDS
jgi:hypothetical protein